MSQSCLIYYLLIYCIQTIRRFLTDVAESQPHRTSHQDDGSIDWYCPRCCAAFASLSLHASLSLLFSYFVHLISGFIEPPFERKSKTYGKFFALRMSTLEELRRRNVILHRILWKGGGGADVPPTLENNLNLLLENNYSTAVLCCSVVL
jgi:hypothetical protein